MLGKIGDERTVEPLTKVLEDKSRSVRESATGALEKMEWKPETDELRVVYLLAKGDTEAFVMWGESAVDPLIKTLKNKSLQTRMLATNTLGKIGCVKGLKIALNDKNQFVRNEAKEALKKLDVEARRDDAEALGNIGDERAVETLIGMQS